VVSPKEQGTETVSDEHIARAEKLLDELEENHLGQRRFRSVRAQAIDQILRELIEHVKELEERAKAGRFASRHS